MPIHFRNRYALNYKEIVKSKFKYLIDYFGYEPGDIFVEVLPLEKFDSFYKLEKGIKPIPFIVGTALSNGRILVLDKKDFSKKQGHNEEEFEEVILHELAHIFVRRLTWPEHAFIWIQEGICEYISFGKKGFKIKNFIPFKEVETEKGWDKYNPYQQAGAFFKFLDVNYGKDKIIQFLKGIKNNPKRQIQLFEEVFQNKFEKIQKRFLENEKPTPSRISL